MDVRKATTEYRMATWARIIGEWADSGETIKDFCLNRGIARYTYYYWQRKLREAACGDLLPATKEMPDRAAPPDGWTVCEVAEADPADMAPGSILVEIGKCRVSIARDTDLALFGEVCRVLVAL